MGEGEGLEGATGMVEVGGVVMAEGEAVALAEGGGEGGGVQGGLGLGRGG